MPSFVLALSVLNLLLVSAGLLLVYFDWSAARRREFLYLYLTEEKPGSAYFAAARHRRAQYVRLIAAFFVLLVRQILEVAVSATVLPLAYWNQWVEWWHAYAKPFIGQADSPDAMTGAARFAAGLQSWVSCFEMLGLALLALGFLYGARPRMTGLLDTIGGIWVAIWSVFAVLFLCHAFGGSTSLIVGQVTNVVRVVIVGVTLWLLFQRDPHPEGATVTPVAPTDGAPIGASPGALAWAFGMWIGGLLLAPFAYTFALARLVDPKDPAYLARLADLTEQAQAQQVHITQVHRQVAAAGAFALAPVGVAIAYLIFVGLIAREVLVEYETMESSRHRLGRERQVIFSYLQRIGSAFAHALQIDEVLSIILDSALETTEAQSGAIYLLNAKTSRFEPRVVRNFFPPLHVEPPAMVSGDRTEVLNQLMKEQSFAAGEGIIGEVAERLESTLIADVRAAGIMLGSTTEYMRNRSMLLVPLRVGNAAIGVITVVNKTRSSFSPVDQSLLQALADQGALSVNNAILTQEVGQQERLRRELQIARDIQQRLLPKECPAVPGFEIGARGTSATEVGGDYYDFFWVDSDRLGIVVADVSGKGVHAALVVAMIKSAFRAVAIGNPDVKDVLARVNEFISQDLRRDMFVTCIYGILEIPSRSFSWARAGHEPIIVTHPSHQTDVLTPLGFALGVLPAPEFRELLEVQTVQLQPGDHLLMFTDGLTEAMNSEGEEFGMHRVLQVMEHPEGVENKGVHAVEARAGDATVSLPLLRVGSRHADGSKPAHAAHVDDRIASSKTASLEPPELQCIERAVQDHVGDAPQSDDLTMVYLSAI